MYMIATVIAKMWHAEPQSVRDEYKLLAEV